MYNCREREVVPVNGGMSPELLEIQVVRSDILKPESFSTDHERQLSKKYEEHSQKMTRTKVLSIMKEIADPRGPYLPLLNKLFLTSWVIAVITDPFFLYIPTLEQEKKCLRMDKKLEIVALVFRSITDFSYVLHILFQLLAGLTPKTYAEWNDKQGFLDYASKRAGKINWSYVILDVLAVLPVPQVIILVFFSKIRPGFRPSNARKILLYIVLLFQYVPKVFGIYLCCEALKKTRDTLRKTLWVRGTFNLFLYIIASHILGAFWYFFSVEQETTCWQYACKNQTGCLPCMFNTCNDNTPRNLTFVNDFCPINPSKTTDFDFGIFLGANQSGIVASTDFPKKVLHCFWWGMRNLSSFGSNLEASSAAWENCFAALISMLGLLIFLYLIGNLQLYMQLPTQRSEDRRHNRKEEIRKIVEGKKPDIHLWASRNLCGHDAPGEVTTGITAFLQDLLETEKDLDSKKQLKKLQVLLKAKHPTKKLENGQHLSEKLGVDHPAMGFLKTIHLQLKDIISGGTKHQWSKTKESAQLWMLKNGIPKLTMLMIKQYIQHRLQNSNDDVDIVYLFSVPELQNIDDQVYEETIKHLKPVSYAENSYIIREGEPIGHLFFVTQGVVWVFGNGALRSVAKGDYYVEGLALKAVDLNHILLKYWWKFPIAKQYEVELLKRFAAGAIEEAWQRCQSRRQKDPSLRWTALNRKITSVTAFSSIMSNP
ncbi:hypothetical protein TIFTF001_013628 [Ficus carica]|uniref:Cyclic nucleotide-binding domain-containing protein n=1 Tax=Ficus carica TaxID=3494 RepID=A0AA87ZY36_FICCA|nr:hypothetical protein TIFTF001_013628 [Ficus carica]